MKPIRLPFRAKVILSDKVAVLNTDDFQQVREQCMKVVSSASSIEDVLTSVLEAGLFHGFPSARRAELRAILLDSEWCTFSAKRKLLEVVRSERKLTADDWPSLDRNLSKVTRYRNALAHGSLSVADGVYWLSYFEGAPQRKVLDDHYWADVEAVFDDTFKALMGLERQLASVIE